MTEIEAIYARHSVRAYQNRRIEPEKIARLKALIDELNTKGALHLQFIEHAGRTFSRLMSRAMGLGSAPSVIACVGPDDATLDERIGYYGEQLVLAAQMLGLNTCWAGTFHRAHTPAEVAPGERLVIVIAIGYGENAGKPRRSKQPEQVSTAAGEPPAWFTRGVELALLAPTAINQQRFEITLNPDRTVSFADKGGVLSRIDLGIVRYHFEVGRRELEPQSP